MSAIIHTISTRNVSTHEFILAELMFKYNLCYESTSTTENCLVADYFLKSMNSVVADSSAVMCQASLARLKEI